MWGIMHRNLWLMAYVLMVLISAGSLISTCVEIGLFARHRLDPAIFFGTNLGKAIGSIGLTVNSFCWMELSGTHVGMMSLMPFVFSMYGVFFSPIAYLSLTQIRLLLLAPFLYSSIHFHRYKKWKRMRKLVSTGDVSRMINMPTIEIDHEYEHFNVEIQQACRG
jgi:hypothetical protein